MIIGIDLGTCYSASAYMNNSEPQLIPNEFGNRITPSCVAISKDEILIGESAVNAADDDSFVFIEKSKILIGSDHIYRTPQGVKRPEDIAEYIIRHVLQYSEKFTGKKITQAVITVPAYFNAYQRKLTKDSAEKTGIQILRVISEPTAASLISKGLINGEKILVYDLGGGTFDCSILEVHDDWTRVIATHGDTQLGGKNFDEYLAKKVLSFTNVYNYDNLTKYNQQKILRVCEQAKKQLSASDYAYISLSDISLKATSKITQKEFEEISKPLLNITRDCIFRCLKDSELEPSDISRVYMVGGSTRMKSVSKLLESIFGIIPKTLGNPDESVALGAAVHAYDLSGEHMSRLLIDALPLSLSVKLDSDFCKKIIMRNSPIPTSGEEVFTTAFDYQEKVVIDIFQGENELSKNNIFLGSMSLTGIEKALKGEPKIMVTFSVDENAVIHVAAKDIKTESEANTLLQYDYYASVKDIDESLEILAHNLKLELTELKSRSDISDVNKDQIDSALLSSNIEFMQAVISDIKHVF